MKINGYLKMMMMRFSLNNSFFFFLINHAFQSIQSLWMNQLKGKEHVHHIP